VKANRTLFPSDADQEIAALVKTLHETGQRLELLTAGEVDSVADRTGHMFLLRRAQEQLRVSEVVRQAAILDALPAQVALLDVQGRIVAVNEAWQRQAGATAFHGAGYEVGNRYVPSAGHLSAADSIVGREAATGVQSVLNCTANSFSIEFPSKLPTEERWFLMTVSPLADSYPSGAVIMLMDITERRRLEAVVIEASSREQRRFALDLHDVLGQDLVGLSLLAVAAARDIRKDGAVDPSDLDRIAAVAEIGRAHV
jgi:PAS domain-containing protein